MEDVTRQGEFSGSVSPWHRLVVVAVLAVAGALALGVGGASAALPTGFSDTTVFSGLTLPTAVRFAPNGQVFVAQKGGQIYEYDGLGDTTPSLVADLSDEVQDYWDRGLLGLEVDPNYPASPYIYALYTIDARVGTTSGLGTPWGDQCPDLVDGGPGGNDDGCAVKARLVRLTVSGSPPVATATTVLIDQQWCAQFPSHTIGDLHFGGDGYLYVSGGDGADFNRTDYGLWGGTPGSPTRIYPCGDPPVGLGGSLSPPTAEGGALRSQSLLRPLGEPRLLNGTVIRIDPDTGAAAPDNPLVGSADANEKRVVASGLRNPFRFAVRKDVNNELWVADVGWNSWEEVDRVPNPLTAPLNFGWPCFEGGGVMPTYDGLGLSLCSQLKLSGDATAPYFTYHHDAAVSGADNCATGGGSVSAIAFYTGSAYPAQYDGALFFGDYSRNCIWVMLPTNGTPDPSKVQSFHTTAETPVGLEPGPASASGDMFYVDIIGGSIHRISASIPSAVATATSPTAGPTPLTVSFTAAGSSAPNGHGLSYAWDLDGNGTFGDATSQTASRVYGSDGVFDVRVRVTDTTTGLQDTSAPVHVVAGGSPPDLTISSPSESLTWQSGDTISFSGSAMDAEDGPLDPSALTWDVVLRHCNPDNTACHTHFLQTFTGVASGSFPAPDHEYPSHLELTLSATDSTGITATKTIALQPQTTTVQMQANVAGLQLSLGSGTATAPFTGTVIVNTQSSVTAPSPQVIGGVTYTFLSWSDGGGQTHTITPGGPLSLTATYTASADLALGKAASASSVEPPSPDNGEGVFTAAKAVDGDPSTRWSSDFADNQWWQVDLGSAQQVSSVSIDWETAYASSYTIQVSTDGTSFTDVATVSLSADGVNTTTFATVPARYVRVLGLTRATEWGFSFQTVQVFGPGAVGGSGGGSGGGGTGGGASSGGSTGTGAGTTKAMLPDLAASVATSKPKGLRIGDVFNVVVTVKNKGEAATDGVHVVLSLPSNSVRKGKAVVSGGNVCTGNAVLSCDLGSAAVGSSMTVRVPISVKSGRKLVVQARVSGNETDPTPADNVGTVTETVLPPKLTVAAVASRVVAGKQTAYVKLSVAAHVTAQFYVGGKAQPIVWQRSLPAGTTLVRIAMPHVAKGSHLSVVLRAVRGGTAVTAKLTLTG